MIEIRACAAGFAHAGGSGERSEPRIRPFCGSFYPQKPDSGPRRIGWTTWNSYVNLVKNPVVTIEIGSERFQARATARSGAQRQRLFDAQAKLLPVFDDYQKKTSREIPVVVLERMS
jgi:hypothetical protein